MSGARFQKWPVPSDDLLTFVVRIPPGQIGFVSAIFEGYEGVAVLRTRDQNIGLLEIWAMPGQRENVEKIFAEFRRDFKLEIIREESGHPDLHEEIMEPAQ